MKDTNRDSFLRFLEKNKNKKVSDIMKEARQLVRYETVLIVRNSKNRLYANLTKLRNNGLYCELDLEQECLKLQNQVMYTTDNDWFQLETSKYIQLYRKHNYIDWRPFKDKDTMKNYLKSIQEYKYADIQ